jgi:hypothetical protein
VYFDAGPEGAMRGKVADSAAWTNALIKDGRSAAALVALRKFLREQVHVQS